MLIFYKLYTVDLFISMALFVCLLLKAFITVHTRIRCFWAVAWRHLVKVHLCWGISCQSCHLR